MTWVAMSPALYNTEGPDDFAIAPTKTAVAGGAQSYVPCQGGVPP